ncbi:MAG: hypothetical protein ABGZ35_23775, partial [Planctomycetaceae bacterium]
GEGHRRDGRSDVFSLGVVLYELLTGTRPFRGSSMMDTLQQVISHDPRPPRELVDSISPELERICLKTLSKRASDRYATAADFADDLEQWLKPKAAVVQTDIAAQIVDSEFIQAKASVPAAPSFFRKHITLIAVGSALCLLVATALAVFMAGGQSEGVYEPVPESEQELDAETVFGLIDVVRVGDDKLRRGEKRDAAVEYRSAIPVFQTLIDKYSVDENTPAQPGLDGHFFIYTYSRLGFAMATVGRVKTLDAVSHSHLALVDEELQQLVADATDWVSECTQIADRAEDEQTALNAADNAAFLRWAKAMALSQRAELLHHSNPQISADSSRQALAIYSEVKHLQEDQSLGTLFTEKHALAYLTEGKRYVAQGDYAKARSEFEKARQMYIDANDTINVAASITAFADALGETDAVDQAVKEYDSAVQVLRIFITDNVDRKHWGNHTLAVAEANRARILSVKGEGRDALEGIQRAKEILEMNLNDVPDDMKAIERRTRYQVRAIKGEILVNTGRYDEASGELQEAIEFLSGDSDAQRPRLGNSYMYFGRAIHLLLKNELEMPLSDVSEAALTPDQREMVKTATASFQKSVQILEELLPNQWCRSQLAKCHDFYKEWLLEQGKEAEGKIHRDKADQYRESVATSADADGA